MTLSYPIFLVENDGKLPFQYRVVTSQSDFVWWLNVPRKGTYSDGKIYTSDGQLIKYKGEGSKLLADGILHSVLENTVLPSLFYKAVSSLMYFGPELESKAERLSLGEFKKRLVADIAKYETASVVEKLTEVLQSSGSSYSEVLMALGRWIYEGPTRSS